MGHSFLDRQRVTVGLRKEYENTARNSRHLPIGVEAPANLLLDNIVI